MAAHRYWRLRSQVSNDGLVYLIAEMEMRETPGGSDVTGSGTAFGTAGHFSAAEGPDKAFNNNAGDWHQPNNAIASAPAVTGYDFGAGNEKDIVEVTLLVHASFLLRTPACFAIEWSDDNITYTPLFWVVKTTWSGAGPHVFSLPTIGSTAPYWALINIQSDPVDLPSCVEIDFFDGGLNITSGGTGFASPPFSSFVVANAFDNNTSTIWNDNRVRGVWIGYQFASPVNVDRFDITARSDGFPNLAPATGIVGKSNDGIVFLQEWAFSNLTNYTSGEVRQFDAPVTDPTVSLITPDSGTDLGGTAVTITGLVLSAATGVLFDGVAATSFVVVNSTTLTCVTPAGTIGLVDVTVEHPDGDIVVTDGYEYTAAPPPTLVSVTPDSGIASGGTAVTIIGTDLTGATGVTFGGVAATSFVVVDPTTITCVTPAGLGLVDVELLHADGDFLLEDAFTYINEARVTQIPLLVIHKPVQDIRVTQIPLLVVSLPIQASRITQMPLLPVWTPTPIPFPAPIVPDVPMQEAWTYRTVVTLSENGSEQRARLREVPRLSMSFSTVILDDEERRLAFDLLFKAQRNVFAFPLYQYSTPVTASASAGGTALAFDASRIQANAGELLALFDPGEFVTYFVTASALTSGGATVSALPLDVPAGWLVCGVTNFRTDPVVGLQMDAVAGTIELTLVSVDDRAFVNSFSDAEIATYDGVCVLADRPLAGEGVDDNLSQNVEWLDNEINRPEPITNWPVPFVSGTRQYLARRPDGLHKWRAFADHVKGRQGAFLLPTFRDDFPLTAVPTLGATVLHTSRIQYFDYWRNLGYRYLRIVTANGVIYRRILEVIALYDANGDPYELTLKLNTALGVSVGDNIISAVSLMLLCRLDDDTIRLEHLDDDTIVELDIKGVNA